MTEAEYKLAEDNANLHSWVIISTDLSDNIDIKHNPFYYQARAVITLVDPEFPEYPDCESEQETIKRHLDIIIEQCNKNWGPNWEVAKIVNVLFPEETIYRKLLKQRQVNTELVA
jgi:hypothetical protein